MMVSVDFVPQWISPSVWITLLSIFLYATMPKIYSVTKVKKIEVFIHMKKWIYETNIYFLK